MAKSHFNTVQLVLLLVVCNIASGLRPSPPVAPPKDCIFPALYFGANASGDQSIDELQFIAKHSIAGWHPLYDTVAACGKAATDALRTGTYTWNRTYEHCTVLIDNETYTGVFRRLTE
jgi:hypothetical protein